jgi:hypothetical protein
MSKTKLKPVLVYLTPDLKKRLDEKRASGYTISALVRKFLLQGLENMPKEE